MLEFVNNKVIAGESVYDHYTGKTINITKRNEKNYVFGVVSYDPKEKSYLYGFFRRRPLENIMVFVGDNRSALAISKDIFGENLVYSNDIGLYKIYDKNNTKGRSRKIKGSGEFPYSIKRLYESHDHLKDFDKSPVLDSMYNPEIKDLLKYTFGLEYETVGGYIPQELCYKYGLIPLRDGSIAGVEYASSVMDKSDGLERITKHLELLKEYTFFDKDCSLHVHLGGFPLDEDAIFALYVLWDMLTPDLIDILPDLAFKTSMFKNSRKDYCKLNPSVFRNFQDLYSYLAAGRASYAGSLTQSHPQDPEKRAKWQIRERYWAQSLIGMCFYNGPKTVEYRMLAPTYNIHKIIFWIYMFNAIMIYAERLADKYRKSKSMLLQICKSDCTIEDVINDVYPTHLASNMMEMIQKLKHVVKLQFLSGDSIGSNIEIEDDIIKSGIIE